MNSFPSSPPVSRPGVTTVNVEGGNNEHTALSTFTRHAQHSQNAEPLLPFLQIPGCRPLLTLLFLLFLYWNSWQWFELSDVELPKDDTCNIIHQFLTATNAIAALCIVYIHTLPFVTLLRLQWCRSALPRLLTVGLLACAFAVTLAAVYIMLILPNDDTTSAVCWNNQPLRDLTLYNILLVLVCMTCVIGHNIFNEDSDFSRVIRARMKLPSFRHFLHNHWKISLLSLSFFMCYLGYSSNASYYDALSTRYHWSFSDRPAACQTSCNNERWHMNKRRPICLDGNLNKVQLEVCLDGLPPREMPSNNHVLFQQCPVLVCRYPNGERVKFYWALRHERIIGSDGKASFNLEGTGPLEGVHTCSKHDARKVSRATLLQEWVCWDDGKHLWVDDPWCHGMQLPYATGDAQDAIRILHFEAKHCINPCMGMRPYAEWSSRGWALLWFILVISFLMQQCGVCHPSDISHFHFTDAMQQPDYDSGKLQALQRAQLELARRCRDRFFFTRCRITLCFVLAYGPKVLHEGLYLFLRVAATLFIFAVAVVNANWLVWLLDATCVHYSWWIIVYSSITFIVMIILILQGIQTARILFHSGSQQLTSPSSYQYSHLRTKSAH